MSPSAFPGSPSCAVGSRRPLRRRTAVAALHALIAIVGVAGSPLAADAPSPSPLGTALRTVAKPAPSALAVTTDPAYRFYLFDDFEDGQLVAWDRIIEQNTGSHVAITNITSRSHYAVSLAAGAKVDGVVGKAHLSKQTSAVGEGQVIDVKARYTLASGTRPDSVLLMDVECRSCGVSGQPGIRLYLRNGYLRVDRAKIGIAESFDSRSRIPVGSAVDLRLRLTLGKGSAGRTEVFRNGARIINGVGTNMIDRTFFAVHAVAVTAEHYDCVQIGLTANSQTVAVKATIDDVTIAVPQ